jgi:hypothetical protein
MRTATKILTLLCGFAVLLGIVYWLVTKEAVGTVLLLSFACMPGIVVAYTLRHGMLAERRSEDDAEADPRSRAGETLGPFPAETVWPILLVLGVVTIGASLIYGLILLPLGAALFLWAVVGFARESRD